MFESVTDEYFKENVLSRDEEMRLIALAQSSDVEASKTAIERLERAYRPMIMSFAARRARNTNSWSKIGDIVQCCELGFMIAIHKFRMEENFARLATVAPLWIRQCLQGMHRSEINGGNVNANVHRVMGNLNTAMAELGCDPMRITASDIARLSQWFSVKDRTIVQAMRHMNLIKDVSISSGSRQTNDDGAQPSTLESRLVDPSLPTEDDILDRMSRAKICSAIMAVVERLPERDRDIVKCRIFSEEDDRKLISLGAKYNLSKERTRQIYENSINAVIEQLSVEAPEIFPTQERLEAARAAFTTKMGSNRRRTYGRLGAEAVPA